MSTPKREELIGRGAAGKTAVVGMRDPVTAKLVDDTTGETLQGFVREQVISGPTKYTDDSTAYASLPNHEAVKQGVSGYVRSRVHTNGIESFWATLKRTHKGTFHRL